MSLRFLRKASIAGDRVIFVSLNVRLGIIGMRVIEVGCESLRVVNVGIVTGGGGSSGR